MNINFLKSIAFQICSLFYICMLIFLYFSKKRIKTEETSIFSYLLICNLIGLILDIFSVFTISHMEKIPVLNFLISKGYLIYLLTWISIFTYYIFVLSKMNNTNSHIKEYIYKVKKKLVIWYCIFLVLTLLLPLYYNTEPGNIYSYGPAAYALYFYSALCIGIWIIILVNNLKNIKRVKCLPIFAYMLLGVVVVIIQFFNPNILLMTSMETYVIFIMYHTIENPDVKLINQLELAKEQADKANQAKTDFLSSMSHEIRTPLNAIVGFSDCVIHADTLEEAKDNAKDIVSASNTLLEIVNGILDISKIEAGKLEIIKSPYDAHELFSSLAKLIKPRMEEKGLDFQVYIAPDLPKVLYGDHANVKKIVTNILSNASKYTDKGFVRYEVNCVNNLNRCRLIISVEDSGRGIKTENVDKLFTKFQRLDEDRNTTIEGTGLGLAITKQLVELMGGKIIVHTVYGEGSKFTIILDQPIEKDTALQSVEKAKVSHLDLTGYRILVVDDNTLNLKVSDQLLKRYHADVTCVDSGYHCLEKIMSGEGYDIILLDDMMPKMSGVETLKELKKLPKFSIPVVALTANAITGMREKYMKEGFDDYLAKPIEKDELIRVFATLLHLKEDVTEKLFDTTEILDVPEVKTSTPNNVYNEDYLRSHGVKIDHALELLGDMEMYNMTLKDYLDEIDEKFANLKTFLKDKDMANYAILVHSMKSDAKYLGFMSFADIAYQHELKSKENNLSYCQEHFPELEKELQKYLTVAREYYKHIKK